MADFLRFKKLGDGYLESEFFRFTKDEVLKVFELQSDSGADVTQKVAKHEQIIVESPKNLSFKYIYKPFKDSENDYAFQIMKPVEADGFLYESFLGFLQEKDPLPTDDNQQWAEKWDLKT